jgi:Kef-type K+ transport system membrane component KefB/mannitol/fructose-specific phosphotransferase system IIA component (Ntr-type)
MLLVPPPSLPFTDPVLVVATASLVFLVVPLLFERFRVPGIIGLILAGAAIGPHGAGLLARSNTIVLLGTVGLLYLMLLVGLELDLHQFARYRARSLGFGTLSFLVPGALGVGMGMALGYPLPSALLIGSVFSSHTLLAYPIASRLGIVRNAAVTAALGGTILTEVLALLVLAIVVKSRGGALDAAFWLGLAIPFALYVAVVLLGLPRLGRWFFRNVSTDGSTEFIFVLAALFAASYTAHFGGVEPIIGALLAGLALNRLIPAHGALMSRIHFAGNAIFIPFFLLSVGMLVDVRALQGRAVGIATALTGGVVAGKWLASFVAEKVFGWTGDEGWTVFGLTVPHAAGTLAIVLVGFEAGLLDQTEVNGVVLMILVTCLAGPWAVERFGRRVALREEQRPYDPRAAPRRIVVSLSKPETADTLMDLAFILRGAGTDEPVHPLMVVRGEGSDADAEAEVAEAEKVLAHAVVHAAAAEVPVVPLTRVDPNVAAGIARGVAETRGSLIVLGWNARRGPGQAMFGGVLDQLLQRTRQAVVAARVERPVNTTGRVVLLLPPAIERHAGFGDALRTVNLLASGAGADLEAISIGGEPERLKALHAQVKPALPAAWERVDGWGELLERLGARVRPGDLVVLASARRGTLAWHPRLVRLPEQLAALVPGSLLLVYPAEPELADGAARLSDGVAPERVVRLGPVSFVAAVGRLLEGVFDEDTGRELANIVVRNEEQFSSELVPGVVLPHVRLKGLARPVLLLGVSREGVEFPRARHPARLIFLLVSPAERAEEHLQMLAEVARLLSAPERVREMMDRFAPGTELDWLHVDD